MSAPLPHDLSKDEQEKIDNMMMEKMFDKEAGPNMTKDEKVLKTLGTLD